MKNILIIDDDMLFGESLCDSFKDEGFSSTYIEDPTITNLSPELGLFDTVLIDLRLKGLTGTNLIVDIKRLWPGAYIIVMTGFGTISTAVDAIKKGADDYITKPVTVEKVRALFDNDDMEEKLNGPVTSLDRIEREYIEYILAQESGNISKAAKKLGLHRQSLQRKLKKWVPDS
ncbi:response regulator transcription factor [Halobacteriovorax sp. HLS]|uniref:response regulator transcription factor n=1 Tax=Halobacteriovorax sp. HLS TaxID=2234000 RepID=UPI000FDC94B4|nr:response regulator [Halobacteriovorax sp. HLS]